ncbi:MAG: hypothetical protein ACOYL8_00230 [Patescibacteria group bacterium]
MEKEKMKLDVLAALRQYSLVLDVNRKISEVRKLKEELEKLSKQDNLVIFQKEVSMEFVKACNGSMFHEDRGTLDKINISCSLRVKDSFRSLSDFFLRMHLYSGENTYSFIIAKNKGGDAGYLVQTKDKELLIEDGGGAFVRFLSAEDFHKVINYCDESIEMVNVFLKEDKLVRHLNALIVGFD